jgi:hypothetical protein
MTNSLSLPQTSFPKGRSFYGTLITGRELATSNDGVIHLCVYVIVSLLLSYHIVLTPITRARALDTSSIEYSHWLGFIPNIYPFPYYFMVPYPIIPSWFG